MKKAFCLFLASSLDLIVHAQVTINATTGTFQCLGAAAGKDFCAAASLTSNIIIRCSKTVGQPGNCNDNLAGVPPVGVKDFAPCYQSSPTAGDAACSYNGTVYPENGSAPFSISNGAVASSSSSASSSASKSSIIAPTTSISSSSTSLTKSVSSTTKLSIASSLSSSSSTSSYSTASTTPYAPAGTGALLVATTTAMAKNTVASSVPQSPSLATVTGGVSKMNRDWLRVWLSVVIAVSAGVL